MEMAQIRKEKDEENLWKMGQGITPLGGWRNSNMSGEKPPLEVQHSKDKTQEQFRRESSLIT